MKRLNIFVDETGEFGFGKGSSRLYGVSFTFHEQKNDIISEINELNNKLQQIGYTEMIHMADLIMKRGDYSKFDIKTRQNIFKAIYNFLRKTPIKYHTIIIDKKYTDNNRVLKQRIFNEINEMVANHTDYFYKFDKIVMYYDNGQKALGKILDEIFLSFDGFEHRIDFGHKEKRLFQVSDMLTYIDKYVYKFKNNISFSKGELYFFSNEEMRKIIKKIDKKRF